MYANPLEKPQRETRTLLLTALCAAAVLCCLYAVLRAAPFGPNSVITGDLNGQYIRYFANFRTALLSGEGIAYSFTKGLGGSMLGVFAYCCTSPFNLLYLLVPPVHYALLAGLVMGLKLITACVTMAFFLGRRFPRLGLRAAPCALCYGFCMYALAYAQNIMWHDTLLLLPLVCWGIYKLVHTGRPYVFALGLFASIFTNFYTAFMVCLFSVLFFGYELLLARGYFGGTGAAAEMPLRTLWLRRCGGFALGAVCGGGLSAALLLPVVLELSGTKGLAGAFALTGKVNFKLSEFFHRLLPGSFIWEDVVDGLPNVYCGTLIVVLAVLYFCAKGIGWREKLLSGAFLLVLFFSLYSWDFYLVWHGLRQPVWFPYRNSFLFSFFLVLLAGSALARARVSRTSALCALGAGGVFLLTGFLVRHTWFTMTRFCMGALACAAFCALCAGLLWAKRARVQRVCGALVLALCMAELVLNGAWVLPEFEQYTDRDYRAFVTEGEATVQALKQHADQDAARMEKTFFMSLNDPMTLNYNGVSHFSSARDVPPDRLMTALGYKAFGNTVYGRGSTAFADALLGIRYVMAKDAATVPAHLRPLELGTPWLTYEHPDALPLAFFVPQDVAKAPLPKVDDARYNTFEGQNAMFQALSGLDTPLFTPVPLTARETQSGQEVAVTGTYKTPLTYSYRADAEGLYYAALASKKEYFTVFETRDNADVYFTGEYYGVLNLGRYQQGEQDALRLSPTVEQGMDLQGVYVYRMDEALLAQFAQGARENAPQLTVNNASLHGSVSAPQDSLLLLSVPYDPGLRVTLDGEQVPIVRCFETLCGVQVPAGQHTLRMTYRAPYVWTGLAVSLLFGGVLAGAYVRQRRAQKNNKGV